MNVICRARLSSGDEEDGGVVTNKERCCEVKQWEEGSKIGDATPCDLLWIVALRLGEFEGDQG